MLRKDLRQRFLELNLRFMETKFKFSPKDPVPATSKSPALIVEKVTATPSTMSIPPQASGIPELEKGKQNDIDN